jgi:hypothetical protein
VSNNRLTVAEIFRGHGRDFLSEHGTKVPGYQKKALWLLANCQTAALGGHLVKCGNCEHKEYRHNSCRHRGCPQCEGTKEAKWLLAREEELLPVHYFHVVFTVPHVLNELFLNNQRQCFEALFQAVAKTLQTVAKNRLKAKLGFFSILHTWGQQMDFHPHVHCVVPGGGLSLEGNNWISSSKKRRYFAPTKVLAEVFRGILVKALKRQFREGKLRCDGNFELLLNSAVARRWVVHAQPPFGSALQVLKYLSRYTRKVAITNSRLINCSNGKVTFSFKDYANGAVKKTCCMKTTEFIRRFLMHIPPPGFVRIRHYGFMAGKNRKALINQIKKLIAGLLPIVFKSPKSDGSFNPSCCPKCGKSALAIIPYVQKFNLLQDTS